MACSGQLGWGSCQGISFSSKGVMQVAFPGQLGSGYCPGKTLSMTSALCWGTVEGFWTLGDCDHLMRSLGLEPAVQSAASLWSQGIFCVGNACDMTKDQAQAWVELVFCRSQARYVSLGSSDWGPAPPVCLHSYFRHCALASDVSLEGRFCCTRIGWKALQPSQCLSRAARLQEPLVAGGRVCAHFSTLPACQCPGSEVVLCRGWCLPLQRHGPDRRALLLTGDQPHLLRSQGSVTAAIAFAPSRPPVVRLCEYG